MPDPKVRGASGALQGSGTWTNRQISPTQQNFSVKTGAIYMVFATAQLSPASGYNTKDIVFGVVVVSGGTSVGSTQSMGTAFTYRGHGTMLQTVQATSDTLTLAVMANGGTDEAMNGQYKMFLLRVA